MPLAEVQRTDGPNSALQSFAEACTDFWPLVSRLIVKRCKRPTGELVSGKVTHITGRDEQPIDDSLAVLGQFAQICRDDAEKHGAGEYIFEAWGVAEAPTKGRKTIAPPQCLHSQRIRFGELEDDIKGDASVLREAANLLKTSAAATHDMALGGNAISDGYIKLIGVQNQIITAQAGQVQAAREAEHANASVMVQLKTLEFDFQRQMEQWRRDDAAAELDRRADMERTREYFSTMRHLGDRFSGPLEKLLLLALKKYGLEAAAAAAAGAAGAEGNADPLGPDLAAFVAENQGKAKALSDVLTERVWDMIVGASRKTNDDEIRSIFHSIEREFRGDPAERAMAADYIPAEKAKAMRDRALKALPDILGPQQFQKLVELLIRGGIDLV